ncbi:MAG: type IV secretory system conjugative DNA transfer family protein [Candidatus Paceibacterota bacterium]|nr:type IV secretion system DNA-binding domain-containing protein [Candidatus Paceibacterota bacterium]
MIELFFSLALFFLLFISLFLFFFFRKRNYLNDIKRGMNFELFLVSLPRDIEKEKEEKSSLEEYFGKVEQFFNSLHGFKKKHFFVFEISVHRTSEEIYFYAACPRKIKDSFIKQIQSFWPDAEVSPTSDYNIFNLKGESSFLQGSLAKPPVLPLRSYKEFRSDPISGLTNVLTKLKKEGEGASIQIILRPSGKNLRGEGNKIIDLCYKGKKIGSAVSTNKAELALKFFGDFIGIIFAGPSKEKKQEEKKEMGPIEQQAVNSISEKISKPLFEVNLRLVSSAETKEKSQSIISQLQSSFEQFNSPDLNKIVFKSPSSKAKKRKSFFSFSFRLMSGKKMLLSSSEMAGIFHFPSSSIMTPHIARVKTRQAPPPSNLPEDGIILGKNIFRGEERLIRMKKEDRRRHLYVVGQTGTGKSALFMEMVRQDMENGEGLALVDPHGELAEKVLTYIPKERVDDVVYFNPSDMEKPMGLNMLEYDTSFPESKTFVVNELIEIFEKLYNMKAHGFGGPMFEQYMRNALLLVMDDPNSGSTLIEIPRVLADVNFRKYKLSKCKNIVVKNFWELEAEKAGGEASLANMVPYITSKMNVFIANDIMRPIISQQKSSLNFREIMDKKKILIINLSKGKLGDINSYLLGMIIVGKLLIAAFARAEIPEEERNDFYLYIDEFQNITTKTMSSILAEARKYRLNMIFAHQYIAQIEEDIQKSVFGNVGSMLSFRVGPEDGKFLTSEFQPSFNENDLANFDNYNGALRLLIGGMVTRPFNLATFPPREGNEEMKKVAKELSRLKYGKRREIVETELEERLKGF